MANCNICFENNFNRLVMNITQINLHHWQNAHIRCLIKVNLKKKFVVRSSAHMKYTYFFL